MIQLRVLSGKKAGAEVAARRFPFRIGRAATDGLCLDEEGVWDGHAEIHLDPVDGFRLRTHAEAFALVNGERSQEASLRNGDVLELGSVKLRFFLHPARSRNFRIREVLTWLALAGLTLGQIGLIYWLID